jgi:hypothetical protein
LLKLNYHSTDPGDGLFYPSPDSMMMEEIVILLVVAVMVVSSVGGSVPLP